jgi:hypothetical protein
MNRIPLPRFPRVASSPRRLIASSPRRLFSPRDTVPLLPYRGRLFHVLYEVCMSNKYLHNSTFIEYGMSHINNSHKFESSRL